MGSSEAGARIVEALASLAWVSRTCGGVSDGDVLRDLPHRATPTDFRTRLEVQGSTLATAGILEALILAAGGGVSG